MRRLTALLVDSPAVLSAELRAEWLRTGITLAELGQRMGGLAPQNVSVLLNGSTDPRMSTALRLADALGYDLALIPRDQS